MRRRVFAVTAALALAAGGLVVGSAPAQAAHYCSDDIPCYPHVCVNTSQKPYTVYFCNG